MCPETKEDQKRRVVFDAASDVFANYGFRRTSMNDISEAAGISRPSLYLMFENKEDLFRQLASFRQSQAIDQAIVDLSANAPLIDRFTRAILTYKRIYYEPVSASPHGAELIDTNVSLASEEMMRGRARLIDHLSQALKDAVSHGEANLDIGKMKPREFVELLMSSIGGQMKTTTSNRDYRRKITDVTSIFLTSITSGDSA